ncbi:alpha/beta hydrolase [Chryseolinea sp. T2]|uniref:alpha/beta fold hydrolase n=1 Tax=Chryseolinea sp. T2 TaxID=3129255 RepID=UPI00307691BC
MRYIHLLFICIMTTTSSSIQAQSSGKYAHVNGLKMYYEVHGTGYPLVLIHGGGSTLQTTFGRILPGLANSNQVIAVEMQAHGHTSDINRPMTFEQDADDIAELLRQLNIKKANIFGFSNGASTTLFVAMRHPELVNKIIVASTMYNKAGTFPGFWDMMKQATFEGMPQPYKDAFLEINPDKDALYAMYNRDVTRMQNFKDIQQYDIAAITAPALVMCGNQDVVTVEHAVEMFRTMKNAQLAIFPGGHGDYIGELTTLKPGNAGGLVALPVIETFLSL